MVSLLFGLFILQYFKGGWNLWRFIVISEPLNSMMWMIFILNLKQLFTIRPMLMR